MACLGVCIAVKGGSLDVLGLDAPCSLGKGSSSQVGIGADENWIKKEIEKHGGHDQNGRKKFGGILLFCQKKFNTKHGRFLDVSGNHMETLAKMAEKYLMGFCSAIFSIPLLVTPWTQEGDNYVLITLFVRFQQRFKFAMV